MTNELTEFEKAKQHLMTWSKKKLLEQALFTASTKRIDVWAKEFDKHGK